MSRKSNNTIKVLLILAVLIFMSGIVYLSSAYVRQRKQAKIDEAKIGSLNQELLDLERNILEWEIIIDDKELQIKEYNQLLKQGYDEVRYLENEINRLKREGKVDKEIIRRLEEKLQIAKSSLLERYQKEIEALLAENEELSNVVDSLSSEGAGRNSLYNDRESEIARLQGQLEDAKRKEGLLNAVRDLQAANFNFFNVRGGREEQDISFKQMNIKSLKVEFNILKNELAETGVYDLYLVLKSPSGLVMSNPEEDFGGDYAFEGRRISYSSKTSFHYDRRQKTVYIDFVPAKDEPFVKGTQNVLIYWNGKIIGRDSFVIN